MATKRKSSESPDVTWRPGKVHAATPELTPTYDITRYADIFERFEVGPEHHAVFTAFIETGKAPAEFVRTLEADTRWHLSLEQAFERRLGRLKDALRSLKPKRTRGKTSG